MIDILRVVKIYIYFSSFYISLIINYIYVYIVDNLNVYICVCDTVASLPISRDFKKHCVSISS